MLRKNLSEPILNKPCARISMSRKLPSDFFFQSESPKILPPKKSRKLIPIINDENRQLPSSKTAQNTPQFQRKVSFEFTFYRSPSKEERRVPFEVRREKSSKLQMLEKFNIKLPYIVKSAESGQERRKKLVKVRRQTNFTKEVVQIEPLSPLR